MSAALILEQGEEALWGMSRQRSSKLLPAAKVGGDAESASSYFTCHEQVSLPNGSLERKRF